MIGFYRTYASAGPVLPPAYMAKRKREADNKDVEEVSRKSTSSESRSASPPSSSKKLRIVGPTLPPANLDERPLQPTERDADSSSDDDSDSFGPSLPTDTSHKPGVSNEEPSTTLASGAEAIATAKSQRDEWMIVPPSSGDWSSRVDPTKLKNRKFNTGKGSNGMVQNADRESNANWTETPDEKKARLQREMMGIKDISSIQDAPEDDAKSRENVRKLREYNVSQSPESSFAYLFDRRQEKLRGSTLYKEHQKTNPQEKEDDPSARPFDRDKDIAGGMKINHTQRREMMNKAADFGSRFSSGKFL